MSDILPRLSAMFQDLFSRAAEHVVVLLPQIVLAITFLIVGWAIAAVIHRIVEWVLGFLAVDKLAAKTPLAGLIKGMGIEKTVSEILGLLVFWLVIFFTLVVAADTLELQQVSYALALVARFIPQIIGAMLTIIIGMLVAKFLQMFTVQALGHMNPVYKKSIGNTVQAVVLFFVFIAAVDQLGFELGYIIDGLVTISSVVLLMLGLGMAIGARTVLDNALASQQVRRQLPVGAHVSIEEVSGVVKEFTLTSVVLDTKPEPTVLPATHFLKFAYTVHSA